MWAKVRAIPVPPVPVRRRFRFAGGSLGKSLGKSLGTITIGFGSTFRAYFYPIPPKFGLGF